VIAENIAGIARHVEHGDTGQEGAQVRGDFRSSRRRQNHIGEEKMNFAGGFSGGGQGFVAGGGLEYLVARGGRAGLANTDFSTRGTNTRTVVPAPGSLSTEMYPALFLTMP
jgi:hypothetical protein